MQTYFRDIIENENIVKALSDMGYEKPTEVQQKVLPIVVEGKDIIVNSKTGSGKTAAFGVPIAMGLKNDDKKIKALVLTPTRELAVQVDEEIANISKHIKYKSTCVYGQHNINEEIKILDRGVSVVCGTPGRVLDHLSSGVMDLSDLKYLVLDEADRMLDMGFIDQIQNILEYVPSARQTMMFSATIPLALENVCLRYMNDPVTIKIESQTMTVDQIRQYYYKVENKEKMLAVKKLIFEYLPSSLIIFCNTRWQVDRVVKYLNGAGLRAKAVHGGISQSGRIRSMNAFKDGKFNILVATDVAARGIHVDDLEMVINYDIPDDNDNYVHRIGRTGRAGKEGIAVSLISSDKQYSLYEIEEYIGVMIEQKELQTIEQYKESLKNAKKKYGLREIKLPNGKNALQENKRGHKQGHDKAKPKHKSKQHHKNKKNFDKNQKNTKNKKDNLSKAKFNKNYPNKKTPAKKAMTGKKSGDFEFVFKFNDETKKVSPKAVSPKAKPVKTKPANIKTKTVKKQETTKKPRFIKRILNRIKKDK